MSFSLTYLDRHKIKDEEEGLTEPSGLALSHSRDGFWTVSDDTNKVFKLDLQGRIVRGESFRIPVTGLEGIALDPTGTFLLTVKEESNEIVKIGIADREIADRRRLAAMAGYDAIAPLFAGDGRNMGLEGITWNADTGTVFVIKESGPGLLVEVSADLGTIKDHRVLGADNGFLDADVTDDTIDFSGLCYDASRRAFWIVSDQARRIFLYDGAADRVVHSAPLGYAKDGRYRDVKQAEGVAVDPEARRLYVVSDARARLFVFDVRR